MITAALYEEGISYAEKNFLVEDANHLRVDKKLIRERFNLDCKDVLDFGCGMGGMSLWYANNWSCHVHAIDIDRHHISIANDLKKKHGIKNAKFEVRDVLKQPLTDKYDFIVLNDVAEHIPLPILEQIFMELSNKLNFGGGIFVSYPPWLSPYASHVTHVVKIPWCQFLPDSLLMNMIKKNNRQLVGEEESDLVAAYKGLNHLTHRKLMKAIRGTGLKPVFRRSHSIINNLPFLKSLNLNIFPFSFLVTKEFILFENPKV